MQKEITMPATMKQHSIAIIVISVLLICVSTMSYQDEVSEMDHYCEMVDSGAWPNYKNLDCGGSND